tara:strand:+ start:177 stop:368 length:192 start_codon:yes stop_codon:yes gene_type:complete
MDIKSKDNIVKFLRFKFGLSEASIKLGFKLASKNKSSLPISMWSYGIINSQELDKFYEFLFDK